MAVGGRIGLSGANEESGEKCFHLFDEAGRGIGGRKRHRQSRSVGSGREAGKVGVECGDLGGVGSGQ